MMKKRLVFCACFCILISIANAQLEKHTWLVGGNGFFATTKSIYPPGSSRTNEFRLLPNVGIFLLDNFAAGLKAGYTTSKTLIDPLGGAINNLAKLEILELGPFIRYYFLKDSQLLNLFADASYQHGTKKSITLTGTDAITTNEFAFAAGPAIFFTSSVAMEFMLRYGSRKYSEALTENKFSINVGFQIHLKNKNQ